MFAFLRGEYSALKSIHKELNSVTRIDIARVAELLPEIDTKRDKILKQEYLLPKGAKKAFVAHSKVNARLKNLKKLFNNMSIITLLLEGSDALEKKEKEAIDALYALETLDQMLEPMFWHEFHRANMGADLPVSLGVRKGFQIVEHILEETERADIEKTHSLEIVNPANARLSKSDGDSGWTHPVNISPKGDKKRK